MALQSGYICFCGNSGYDRYKQLDDGECNEPCEGNPDEMCGGDWRNTVYSTGAVGQSHSNTW